MREPAALDTESLDRRFGSLAGSYASAKPFPHAVMDDFLPAEWLEAVLDEFPAPDDMEIQFDSARQTKSASQDWSSFGPATRHVIAELNSGPFIAFLERLTGVDHLIPDPHLAGGGLHQIRRGGKLGVHADFNRHEELRVDRRLNLLVYLNKDWDEAWGGAFEMWSTDMLRCEERVAPLFNRCVVFSTTDTSFHGHPDPLDCPPDRSRRSIAMYYYTAGRPRDELSSPHTTLFKDRPGKQADSTRRDAARDLAMDWLPPVLFRQLQRRRRA